MAKSIFDRIKTFTLDTLFPVFCIDCGKFGEWLCPGCRRRLGLLLSQLCPYCERQETPGGRACPKCRNFFLSKNISLPLDALVVSAKYTDPLVSKIIHLLKYRFVSDLHRPLGDILVKAYLGNNLPLPEIIMPVPLHKRRERWRGFNQSELLARYFSDHLTPGFVIPVISNRLMRNRYTKPQMKIKNYRERKWNLKEAFVFSPDLENPISGKRILIIDDVATTGATLFECGKVLKLAGAKEVLGLVVARQELKSVL